MTPVLSPNTQVILLLTAPLMVGGGSTSNELLSPGEYKRLARYLRDIQRQPADLVHADAAELVRDCHTVIDGTRLQQLLGRGFLLSQAIERWQSRAIWVVSRADGEYPQRLKSRLREDAPAVLYGCGDISLLGTRGLAVVGSRHVDDSLIDYTEEVGRLAARAGRTLVSGGARGIDQAAMRGALEEGGKVCGVLADSLESKAMNRENRNLLLDGQLALISPYDPCAGFSVGNAMQRNKLIYALADASLVVSSDLNKGGTWAGAIEQLDKLKLVPVYVRSTGRLSAGLDGLRQKGATLWPNPHDATSFDAVLDEPLPTKMAPSQAGLLPYSSDGSSDATHAPQAISEPFRSLQSAVQPMATVPSATPSSPNGTEANHNATNLAVQTTSTPAEDLFIAVRVVMERLLKAPMKEAEVAAALDVSNSQAKSWLHRLLDEGVVEKKKKPTGYVLKKTRLFQ